MTKSHRFVFSVILFLVPISQVSIDLYAPSLPTIVSHLNTTESSVQQTISLFLISLGIGQFFYGPISDRYGRKKVLLFGMILFTISSLMIVFTNSIGFLIFSRFIQGFASASIAVLSKAVAVDLYKGTELMKATAWIGLVWGISPILAPVLGAQFEMLAGWRLSFIVLAIYGFFGIISVLFFMTETISYQQKLNFYSILKNSALVVKNRSFLTSTIIIAATNLGVFVFSTMGPFIIQSIMFESTLFYANMAILVGFIYLIGAFASRYAIKRFEAEEVIHMGSVFLMIIGFLSAILSFNFTHSLAILMISSSVFSFISGLLYPYLVAMMFSPFQNISGAVSSCYGIISYLLTGIATFLTGFIHITSIKEISYIYALIGLVTFLTMKLMFNIPRKE